MILWCNILYHCLLHYNIWYNKIIYNTIYTILYWPKLRVVPRPVLHVDALRHPRFRLYIYILSERERENKYTYLCNNHNNNNIYTTTTNNNNTNTNTKSSIHMPLGAPPRCRPSRTRPRGRAPSSRPSNALFTLLDLCVSSSRRGHANLLCIVPILTDDPWRESFPSFKCMIIVICTCMIIGIPGIY